MSRHLKVLKAPAWYHVCAIPPSCAAFLSACPVRLPSSRIITIVSGGNLALACGWSFSAVGPHLNLRLCPRVASTARQQLRDRELADPATFERMRFNEDLSTRPNWFPPGTGACHLGVIEWWGKHSNDTPKGCDSVRSVLPFRQL